MLAAMLKMDLIRTIKPLAGEVDWPVWRRKIRDLLDYHEGAVDVLDNKLRRSKLIRRKVIFTARRIVMQKL